MPTKNNKVWKKQIINTLPGLKSKTELKKELIIEVITKKSILKKFILSK